MIVTTQGHRGAPGIDRGNNGASWAMQITSRVPGASYSGIGTSRLAHETGFRSER